MLRTVLWLTRAAAFVLISVRTLTEPLHGPQARPLVIAACAVTGLAMAVWAGLDLLPAADPHRERWLPVIFGVIAGVSGLACAPSGAYLLVIFAGMATMAAGSDTSLVASWTVVGAGALGLEIGGVIYHDGVATLLGYPLLMIGALLIGHNRRAYLVQAKQSAALLAQSEQLQVEQRRADVLDERTRIAREIHDVLAHSLGALGIQIQTARAVLSDHHDVERALDVLVTAQRMASEGLVETRRAVHALRSDTLPLDEEVARASGHHATRYQVPVEFTVGGEPRTLPPAATMALLRVAGEGLVNAAKHAPRQPIDIRLDYGEHDIRLTISNPLGDSPSASEASPGASDLGASDLGARDPNAAGLSTINGGYGLTGMKERLLLVNGTLSAGPRHGHWVVAAAVPQTPVPAAAGRSGAGATPGAGLDTAPGGGARGRRGGETGVGAVPHRAGPGTVAP